MKLLLTVMRAQRNNNNIDLGIVDFVNHAILIDKCRNVFFALKTREFCPRLMGFGNVVFDSLHIARVSKESIARRTDLIGVDAIRFLLGLTDSYALDGAQNLFQTGDKACILYIKN